nr:cell division protein FtsZ [Oceanibacterium hippocampi]
MSAPTDTELKPKIVVFGVGGAGGNAINNMIESELQGVEFVAANTDAQALAQSRAARRIQLGAALTQGLGAGSKPEVGCKAAEETIEEIVQELEGCHMCFITAGMGGGTGTGAAPVVAEAARQLGILTVGVVTKPFQFEGSHRSRLAEEGIRELQHYVDTLIVIPNQNLFRLANEKTTFADAFRMADNVLHSGVRGVTDLMVMPGLINLDFADVNTVMSEMGKAMMGTGEAEGETRAIDAAEAAISNPLLDDVSMKGARGVLINITGGLDLTLYEVDEAANRIRSEVDPEANIIVGSTFDESMEGKMRVSVVATGIESEANCQPRPVNVTPLRRPGERPAIERPTGEASSAPRTPEAQPVTAQASVEAAELPFGQAQPAMASAGEAAAAPRASLARDSGQMSDPAPQIGNLALSRDVEPNARREDSFIAPRPSQPKQGPTLRSGERPTEVGPTEKPKRKSSFFERMTSVARGHKEDQGEAASKPNPMSRLAQPVERAAPAAPEHDPADDLLDQAPVAREPRKAAVQPGRDKIVQKQFEEDLLDIPAFLRRQAN